MEIKPLTFIIATVTAIMVATVPGIAQETIVSEIRLEFEHGRPAFGMILRRNFHEEDLAEELGYTSEGVLSGTSTGEQITCGEQHWFDADVQISGTTIVTADNNHCDERVKLVVRISSVTAALTAHAATVAADGDLITASRIYSDIGVRLERIQDSEIAELMETYTFPGIMTADGEKPTSPSELKIGVQLRALETFREGLLKTNPEKAQDIIAYNSNGWPILNRKGHEVLMESLKGKSPNPVARLDSSAYEALEAKNLSSFIFEAYSNLDGQNNMN